MKSGYYKRERLAFTLFEELQDSNDQNPWSPKAYIYPDILFVLSDLNAEGYTTRNYQETLDLPHVLLTASALARFHAAIANYETTKPVNGKMNITGDINDASEQPSQSVQFRRRNMVKAYNLDDILTEKQVDIVIRKAVGNGHQWKLVRSEMNPAADGLAGFLGDHIKAALHVKVDGEVTIVNIFIKRLPANNKPKAEFIAENNYYRRERLMFSLFEEFDGIDSHPWAPRAYIHTDELLVLPDLAVQGYATQHYLDTLDMPHVLLTVASVARFHAAYANYATKKSTDGMPYNILENYGKIMSEPTFKESTWMRAAAKLVANFIKTFSSKYSNLPNLENALYPLHIEACDSLRDYEDSLNVLLHKDLWMNNIMFKYENGVPVNSILVDFQCLRYGPPAFDIMIFLCLTTSRSFREQYETEVFLHYYKIFCESLDDDTKERIRLLGYDKQNLLDWCERARMFGMLEAMTIFPYVLMDPKSAEKTFDDPETYEKYLHEDRSEPVIAHAMKCPGYKERQLEICEEFIERYLLRDKCRFTSEE